jgi:hypothetical protein
MHLHHTGAASAALVILFAAHPLVAQSQSTWLLGGGLSVPVGEFSSYANNGWDVTAGWERAFGKHPVALRVDLSYARNTDTTGLGFHETTQLTNAMVNVVYHFQGARPHLYMLLGVGEFHHWFSSDDPQDIPINDSRVAIQFGEGVTFRIGSTVIFAEGRFVTALEEQPLRFFPVVVGVRFGGQKE